MHQDQSPLCLYQWLHDQKHMDEVKGSRIGTPYSSIEKKKKTEEFTKILNTYVNNIAPDSDKQNLHFTLQKAICTH